MTEAERIISCTRTMMESGKYKSWSQAMAKAAETIKAGGTTHATNTKREG